MEEDEPQNDNEKEVAHSPTGYSAVPNNIRTLHRYAIPIKIGKDITNGTTTREKTKTKSRQKLAARKESGQRVSVQRQIYKMF